MNTAVAALGVACLVGCANLPPNRPATEPEQRAMAAAQAAWFDAGRPVFDDPALSPARAHVSVLATGEIQQRCLACYPGPVCRDVVACVFLPNRTIVEAPSLLILVSADLSPERRMDAIVHEYLHALRGRVVLRLLSQGPPPSWASGDPPDRNHLDAELWSEIESNALRRWRSP